MAAAASESPRGEVEMIYGYLDMRLPNAIRLMELIANKAVTLVLVKRLWTTVSGNEENEVGRKEDMSSKSDVHKVYQVELCILPLANQVRSRRVNGS